ncbi:MAG: DUF11 domain-containing protein [Candidatus Krumholzibacteriota bacterium]|nr:DUF11 domain-containing protein [Candidatus Krumholzibacteriota bacterium]
MRIFKGRKERAAFRAMALVSAVIISVAGGEAGGAELIDGGTFESGSFSGSWTHNGGNTLGFTNPSWADHDVVLDLPYSGNYSALLGFKYTTQRRNRLGFMYHDVTIPADISSAVLYFVFRQQGYDGVNYDPFTVTIRNTSNTVLATVVDFSFSEWDNQFKDSGWIEDDGVGPVGYDMSAWAGQTVRIYFRQINTYDNFYETWTFVDDVSLVVRHFADLAVDGDGDDLFAAIGSGGGGSSTRSGEEGETVSYLLDIENEGLDIDSYNLSVSPPAGWTVTIEYGGTTYPFPWTTPSIPAGSSISAEVHVAIPSGEPLGGYATILDAVSVAHGNRYDSATLGTNVVPSDHLTDLAIDSNGFGVIDRSGGGGISIRNCPADTILEYAIDLVNAGTLNDSFTVWFTPGAPLSAGIDDGATVHTGLFTTGGIAPGSSEQYTLRVTVPVSLPGGAYNTIVYAASVTDTLRVDAVTARAIVAAPKIDMIIASSGNGIIDMTASGLGGNSTISGERGNTIYFPVIIQNEGGVADSFEIDWDSPGGGWSGVINDGTSDHDFPWVTPVFDPYSERAFTLAVTIPGNAAYDTYLSLLDAISEVDGNISESVTAGISVASGNEIDLLIDGNGDDTYGPIDTGLGGSSMISADPGDTVFFNITVQNQAGGNIFDLEWDTPAGWEVVIGDSTSSLSGVPAGDYTLEVRVPASSTGGTFDIILNGYKANKRYYVDSVTGRVVVSSPALVDAIVDGNGDELFAATGTGAGGYSAQSTVGGQLVNFTVELQNQGADPEEYIVEWNSIPGWTATFQGAASPAATPVIIDGGSGFYIFSVTAPVSAPEGDYSYIIDFMSTSDSTNVESVTAEVHINAPPLADLIIEGDGAFDTAPAGTGEGGRAVVFGDPGSLATALLEIVNRGGFPDSFRIVWQDPAGWPAGSVLLSDGVSDFTSPFVTPLIAPGGSLVFTVKMAIPAGAGSRAGIIIDAIALLMDIEDSVLLEVLTGAFVRGIVFDDSDHDGIYDPGEAGWSGVKITFADPSAPVTVYTDGGGRYLIGVPAGPATDVIELTPGGMISLSPDTVQTGAISAGDTIEIDFADVRISTITPEVSASGPAGGFIELPHTITAGTAGQATVWTALPAGWTDVWYRDVNGDGRLDGLDTRLTSADLDIDPAVPGRDIIRVIVRVYIPTQAAAGTVAPATVTLQQTLGGTSIVTSALVCDQMTVLASASGLLRLAKEVDLTAARPGDIVTYTIVFSNPGIEGVSEIEIIDPVSPAVELVADAFGPGNDIEWVRSGVPVYLTAEPADADEALYDIASGTLRLILSRQGPFVLQSGMAGSVSYRVRIR